MYSAAVSTPSINVSSETPFHVVSNFDHFVTQWMSLVTVSDGRARSSFHVQRLGSSISPSIENDHWSRFGRGVGPAERTGKSLTRYWPGGRRELDAVSRRRPLKPREMNPIPNELSRFARRPASGCFSGCAPPRPFPALPATAACTYRTGHAGPSSFRTSRRPESSANATTPRQCHRPPPSAHLRIP